MKAAREGLKHVQWRQQIVRCQAMIESIDELVTMQSQAWKAGMLKYWLKNLEELASHEPMFTE